MIVVHLAILRKNGIAQLVQEKIYSEHQFQPYVVGYLTLPNGQAILKSHYIYHASLRTTLSWLCWPAEAEIQEESAITPLC